jgi:hypothetical protein
MEPCCVVDRLHNVLKLDAGAERAHVGDVGLTISAIIAIKLDAAAPLEEDANVHLHVGSRCQLVTRQVACMDDQWLSSARKQSQDIGRCGARILLCEQLMK